MSLTSLIWGQSQFDEAVDKATSELRLAEEDIALNLEICDQIRSKSVPPKDAIRALKRRLNHRNPNVQLLTLGLTDVCVKNGGDHFLAEVSSKEFMDNLVSILKMHNVNFDVMNKILRLVQNWSIAFEGKYTLGYVGQVYKELMSQGYKFPPKDMALANSAMIDTSTAPDWIDSDVCLRCRTPFTFTNRKHHCRNCGQVFDQQCSSKILPLPHFGITQEVRVCDGCYTKLNKSRRDLEKSHSASFNSGRHHHSPTSRIHKHHNARDVADADLQRAIQLSLEEANAVSSHRHSQPGYRPSYERWQISEPPLIDHTSRPTSNRFNSQEEDPELKAAIEASLREAHAPKPSAPVVTPYDDHEDSYGYAKGVEREYVPPPHPPLPTLPNHDLHPRESDAIMTFSQTIQDVHAQGSRDLSRLPNVHEMYDRASNLRPKLAMSLDDTGRKEQMLSEMHDKLSQAVRLYDRILTEQVSHPTWRTESTRHSYAQPLSRSSTIDESRRPESIHEPRQHIAISPPAEQSTGYGSPSSMQSQVQRQHSYTGVDSNTLGQYTQPSQWSDQHQQATVISPGSSYQQQPLLQPAYSEPPSSQSQLQPQYYQPSSPEYEHRPLTRENQAEAQLAQSPATYATSQTSKPHGQPYHIQGHIYPLQNQQYLPQASQHPQHVSVPPPVAQPPPSHPLFNQSLTVQSSAPTFDSQLTRSPTLVPQPHYDPVVVNSPPSSQRQQTYHQSLPPSTLPRHNTVGHASYTSPPAPQSTLSWSNTVAYSSQLPQQLPAFPTAPTSNPQAFPLYGPGPPVSGLEQTEKKEVALIDL